MKNLTFYTDESVIGGHIETGVAEAVDSLAVSLAHDYNVTVVTSQGEHPMPIQNGKIFGVTYVSTERPAKAIDISNPDIFHNWGDPAILSQLSRKPQKTVYTIDKAGTVRWNQLCGYDAITTVSEAYAEEIRSDYPWVIGITNGILTEVLNPATGLLLSAKYDFQNISGKKACKKRVCQDYGLDSRRPLFLYMGRMTYEKGADIALECAEQIVRYGGQCLYIGTGSVDRNNLPDRCVRIRQMLHPVKCLNILAGSDFLLYPSREEPCGLMPMTACRYGTIPAVTLTGGLKDNMDDAIAVIIHDNINNAIEKCFVSPPKPETGMKRDFSWKTRKAGYQEVYEL